MSLLPHTRGERSIRSRPRAFIPALSRRVSTGLVPWARPGQRSSRSRYEVVRQSDTSLRFVASDWSTALAVGLNDVELTASDGLARYEIRYRKWATYGLALGAVIGLVLIAMLVFVDMRAYIARHPGARVPGLTTEQNIAVAWAMAIFWGFAFPWILIAAHKGPLRGLMERIIDEVDREAADERAADARPANERP